jgi:hypothetical protein
MRACDDEVGSPHHHVKPEFCRRALRVLQAPRGVRRFAQRYRDASHRDLCQELDTSVLTRTRQRQRPIDSFLGAHRVSVRQQHASKNDLS